MTAVSAAPTHWVVRMNHRNRSVSWLIFVAVLGARGRWLARQNPEWASLLPPDTPEAVAELWQTGDRATRLLVLRTLRATTPDAGRTLLASTWDQEPPDERVAFWVPMPIHPAKVTPGGFGTRMVARLALVAAGMVLLGVGFISIGWQTAALVGSILSLAMFLIYLHPLMAVGIGASLAVLYIAVWADTTMLARWGL